MSGSDNNKFNTENIIENIANKSALFEKDILNNPHEKLKRTNEMLNDIEYLTFIEKIFIHQLHLDFVKKQQDELRFLYNKKVLYQIEMEQIFKDSNRDSNQSQEKFALLQSQLLEELKQKLLEIIKSLDNKIESLQKELLNCQDSIHMLNRELEENRSELSDLWSAKFDDKLPYYKLLNIDLAFDNDINLNFNMDEADLKRLAKDIVTELKSDKNFNHDINGLVNLKSRELLTRMIEKKCSSFFPEKKANLVSNLINHKDYNRGVEQICSHVWSYALQDKKISQCYAIEATLKSKRAVFEFQTANLQNEISFYQNLKERSQEMSKNLTSTFSKADRTDVKVLSPDASEKLISNINKARSVIGHVSNIAELKVKSAESQFHQVIQKLDAAETSAKIQLSNGKADQFDPNDFLNSLNNDKTSFLNSLKKLDSTASSVSKSAKSTKNNEEEKKVTIRPGH